MKIAEFTSRTIQAVLVPCTQLEFALQRSKLANVGVYFLFGDTPSKLPNFYVNDAMEKRISPSAFATAADILPFTKKVAKKY